MVLRLFRAEKHRNVRECTKRAGIVDQDGARFLFCEDISFSAFIFSKTPILTRCQNHKRVARYAQVYSPCNHYVYAVLERKSQEKTEDLYCNKIDITAVTAFLLQKNGKNNNKPRPFRPRLIASFAAKDIDVTNVNSTSLFARLITVCSF